ncbi:F-box protein SKIP22 [Heracleum sosnowskyi]|uniref:F-box protein SKIP22 n=1 Tax=Heracleum sosnowskyi TaxID=360622 RepID=A0AAD8M378_9APIA|nr:F-box protein SKIP22 [Heracleum sosnowskyi]
MKLRLRSIQTNQTLKIEIPNSSSLLNLKEALSLQINSSADSIHLSLNRKEELLGESPHQTLQSLGVISGDLLFFSVNSIFSPDPTRPGFENLQDSVSVSVVESSTVENMKDESVNLKTHEGNCVNLGGDEKTVHLETLENLGDENEGNLDLGDTQMGESGELMEIDDEGVDFNVGKSLSVPGFLRKVFVKELGDDGGNHHKLLVIAVHAVLLESGFVCYDPVKNLVIKGFNFPEKWPSSAFVMSMRYTLPEIVNRDGVRVDGVKTVVLKFQSMGKFFKVYGSLSTGPGTHCVCVNEDQLVLFLNLIWANCGSVSETNENGGVLFTDPAREVFAFWRTVKDKLALPLLIDLCEKAGLELPPCFIRLPTDLKLQILACLPGVDVAKVGCTCSELRYLSSSDDLWKQKFVEQYGDAEPSEGGALWKEKFAKALEKRKRRRIAAGTSLMRRDRHQFPGVMPGPFPGQFPGPFPGQFPGAFPGQVPGIIGGDYDMLPPSIFRPLLLPDRGNPRFRNLLPHCNLGD